MLKQTRLVLVACVWLAACASNSPHVVQASNDAADLHLSAGHVTQIEMPDSGHVESTSVGNPELVDVEQQGDVVNLTARGAKGETNLIIRVRDSDNHILAYQYNLIVP